MKKRLKRFETIFWLFVKVVLYILLMAIFMLILAKENPALIRLSRTMGITISTFVCGRVTFCVHIWKIRYRTKKKQAHCIFDVFGRSFYRYYHILTVNGDEYDRSPCDCIQT